MKAKTGTHSKGTQSVHAGMNPEEHHGVPNVPVYRASTILRPTLDDYRHKRGRYDYARIGTPNSEAIEGAVALLYGSDDCITLPSGLSAVATAVLAVVKCGDSVLVPDSIYRGARRFITTILPTIGVEAIFYDPTISAEKLAEQMPDSTRLIYIETPGSLSFEMQDTAGITALARAKGCLTVCDNTWGTPFYFNAIEHGIDIVIEAGTKYISGHSDVSIGFVASMGEAAQMIRRYKVAMGLCASPDDSYLALRGLRTMPLRLRQSGANGIALAQWIEEQPEVITMLHPALPSHPQHGFWQRDFTGAAGLFAFCLDGAVSDGALAALIDSLELFGIGDSWGGHESLISVPDVGRTVIEPPHGRLIRIYAGLEETHDLLADIQAGFDRLRAYS